MNTFTKQLMGLLVLAILSVNSVLAQPKSPEPVVPGSKGPLPELSDPPGPAEEGRFGTLRLSLVNQDAVIFAGRYSYDAWLGFEKASNFGGEYYILQYRATGSTDEWEVYKNGTDDGYHITGTSVIPTLYYASTDFRLVMHGGDMDGFISNVVTAIYPIVKKCYINSYTSSWGNNSMVGVTVSVGNVNVERDDYPNNGEQTTFSVEDGVYRYQWYRRNPNTFEMTPIEGATGHEYTFAISDVGYEVVSVTTGDDEVVSFLVETGHGIVTMPIQANVDFYSEEGFILNTDYVIPDIQKNLLISSKSSSGVKVPFPENSIKTLKDGQYAIFMNMTDYTGGELFHADDRYNVTFVYNMGTEEEPNIMYREAQLMPGRSMTQLRVKTLLGEDAVATSVDVIGRNLLGDKLVVVATMTPEQVEDGYQTFNLIKSNYYVRARKTETTLDTYYPNVPLWAEATPLELEPFSYQTDWEPTTAVINLMAAPAAMTGTCVIAGTVTKAGSDDQAATRGEAETEVFTVFLKETGGAGDIVAETETDDDGKYRFENVPFGSYRVLLDASGCTMLDVLDVELTAENPAVNNADYVVDGDEIIPATAPTIDVNLSLKQLAYSSDKNLDFSKVSGVKAYVATGYDKPTGTIWLSRAYDIPAGTGFLMLSEESRTYNIPTSYKTSSYYKNMFKAALEGATLQTTDGGYTNYYLSKGTEGVGFYKVGEGGVKLGKNRAYLPIPTVIDAVGEAGPSVAISVGGALQVPYYSDKSLDFTEMEEKGMKAYTATGYDYSTGTIWLSRVKKVPALTGVLIMAPKGNYDVPTVSVASVYENMFKGTLTGTTILTEEDGFVNYYLSNGTDGVGFYKVTKEGGVALGANRCYLQIPKVNPAAASRGAEAFMVNADLNKYGTFGTNDMIGIQLLGSIGGNVGGTTGIESIDNGQLTIDDAYYNLNGQRVDKPGKGLYIHNGKKVMIK